jgi:hypothetical protein
VSYQKRQIVIVVWEDAHGDAHTEVTEDQLPHKPKLMTTLGWLLKNDAEGCSIANEHCADGDATCYRGYTFIPAKMLKSVTPFVLASPRKPRHAKHPVLAPAAH